MDEFQIRVVFLVIGIIIGATANNAYNARKYSRMTQVEVHKILLKLIDIEGAVDEKHDEG